MKSIVTLAALLAFGNPATASAQESLRWGSRNWGESVWGLLPVSVPTLAFAGVVILVAMVAVVTLLPGSRNILKRKS